MQRKQTRVVARALVVLNSRFFQHEREALFHCVPFAHRFKPSCLNFAGSRWIAEIPGDLVLKFIQCGPGFDFHAYLKELSDGFTVFGK